MSLCVAQVNAFIVMTMYWQLGNTAASDILARIAAHFLGVANFAYLSFFLVCGLFISRDLRMFAFEQVYPLSILR